MARMDRGKTCRSIVLLLVAALVVTLAGPMPTGRAQTDAPRTIPFPDVPEHFWARAEIAAMAEKGIVAGKPGGRFDPNSPVTRGQFALMLYRALALPAGKSRFKDVPSGTLLGQAVGAMVEQGIARGYPDGRYRPNEPITRGQMAVMLTRALGLEDVAIARKDATLPFADRFVETQRGYIYVVSYYGLIRGSERNGKLVFRAGHSASRAETAVILYRMLAMREDDRLTERDPAKMEQQSYLLTNLVRGSLIGAESTFSYVNPQYSERWIVWVEQRKFIDPSFPKPPGVPAEALRQAVLRWYDVQTGVVRRHVLPYVFEYEWRKRSIDQGSFAIEPPRFKVDGHNVYLVYPHQRHVLHRIDLRTGSMQEKKLDWPVLISYEDYPYQLNVSHGFIEFHQRFRYYDLYHDEMLTYEWDNYPRIVTENWIVQYNYKEMIFVFYDRRKGESVRQIPMEERVLETRAAKDWLLVETERRLLAIHFATGEVVADLLPDGRLLAVHPGINHVLLERVDHTSAESMHVFLYDLEQRKSVPFEALNRFPQREIVNTKLFVDDQGHAYLTAESLDNRHVHHLFDVRNLRYLGRYEPRLDGGDRIDWVGVQKGELVGLWYQRHRYRKPEDIRIIRVPLEKFSIRES